MDLERDVERRLAHEVGRLGGLCVKAGQDGWPDRIVMLPGGRLWWVELKRPHGKLADLQLYRAVELAKVGQKVVCLWSVDEVDRWIKEIGEQC